MSNSKVDALEAKNSTLMKELITAMESGNRMKEQITALTDGLKAERLLTKQKDDQLQAAKREVSVAGDDVVQAFQLTDEYNGILLSWYFKGFKLLRHYLTKHKPEVDLENLDFEAVNWEMEANEASVAEDIASEGNDDEGPSDGLDDPAI